jgi:hypothetical protein
VITLRNQTTQLAESRCGVARGNKPGEIENPTFDLVREDCLNIIGANHGVFADVEHQFFKLLLQGA